MEQPNNSQVAEMDLRIVFGILKKRYKIIVIVTLLALLASIFANSFVLKPVYQAKAILLVTQPAQDGSGVAQAQNGQGLENLMNVLSRPLEMTINTYIGQLTSDAMMVRVIKKLKLDQQGYTVEDLAGCINVAAVSDTNLIEVSVVHNNPYLAAGIANTLCDEFLGFISDTNEQQMGKSVDFIKKQSIAAEDGLKKAVANLNNLEAQPRDVGLLEQLINANGQELAKFQGQLILDNIEYQRLLAGKQQAERQLNNTPPTITVVKEKDRLGRDIESEEVNPVYNELKMMVNEKTVAVMEKSAEVSGVRAVVTQMNAQLKPLQQELAQKKTTLDMAQKEVARLEETNALFKSKLNETQIGKSLKFGEANLVTVSRAMVPSSPIRPNKTVNMAVAVVCGLMFSVALAFVLNLLDNTVKTARQIEDIGLPVLGQIPVHKPFKLKAGQPCNEDFGQSLNI